jgi:acetyl-CoA acetyltransferase
MSLKNKACIVGIGSTEFTRNAGRSEIHLAVDAAMAACADAGLEPEQIDGMVRFGTAGQTPVEFATESDVARCLGIPNLRYFVEAPWGGGACCATVMHAAMAVAMGVASYVLCFRAIRAASGLMRYGRPTTIPLDAHWSWSMPFGFASPTSWVAMFTRRWMYETGATREQLGAVALVCRENAVRNPRAMFYGRPLTMAEYLGSPMLCDPFKLHDTCLENDGAVALIVTTPERAKDLRQTPAYITGAAEATGWDSYCMTSFYRPKIGIPEMEETGKDLFRMAEMTPKDIQVAQFYDAFTSLVPMQMEALGFCKEGEGGPFCEGGNRIRPDGELPINTSGGMLSESYIHGMNMIAEGVRQIRGTSTTQIKGAENILVTGGLGVPTSAVILTKGRS